MYSYVSAENIYHPIAPRSIREPACNLPARARCGKTAISLPVSLQDRVHLPGRIQLLRRWALRFVAR